MSLGRKIFVPTVLTLSVTGVLGGTAASVVTAVAAPAAPAVATFYHNTPRVLADGSTPGVFYRD